MNKRFIIIIIIIKLHTHIHTLHLFNIIRIDHFYGFSEAASNSCQLTCHHLWLKQLQKEERNKLLHQ